jgi:phosphoglycerate dehydrogenase-like enzyme
MITVSLLDTIPTGRAELKRLEDAGYSIRIHTVPRPLSEEEVAQMIPGARAWICGTDRFTRKALAQADRLEVLSRSGVGYDAIDVEACNERGIFVTTTPGANDVAVAEFTIGLIFALARQIVFADAITRKGTWERHLLNSVSPLGRTLGIVGMGRVGRALARLAVPLGIRVQYFDILGAIAPPELDVRSVSMEELLATSDFVSLHVPLTAQTRGLISAPQLAAMKPAAYLINTARGGIVDETAAAHALKTGRIAGAALDVFVEEPLQQTPLFECRDRLILTPHLAGLSVESKTAMLRGAVDNVLAILAGERPPTIVNEPKEMTRRA